MGVANWESQLFNLIVSGAPWKLSRDTFDRDRVLEMTDKDVEKRFKVAGELDFDAICRLPTLFATETGYYSEQARVGIITRIKEVGKNYQLDFVLDPDIAPIPNGKLVELANVLDFHGFEFTRIHWAIKDADLFYALLKSDAKIAPKLFRLGEPLEEDLVSVMMPFDAAFDRIYEALQGAVDGISKRCHRANDIWRHEAIIQDVVSLIERSRIVICDLTGRNANVFYEAGIAHAIGKHVVLITQAEMDVPFDLRHLRHIHYLNNGEGLADLQKKIHSRLTTLLKTD